MERIGFVFHPLQDSANRSVVCVCGKAGMRNSVRAKSTMIVISMMQKVDDLCTVYKALPNISQSLPMTELIIDIKTD